MKPLTLYSKTCINWVKKKTVSLSSLDRVHKVLMDRSNKCSFETWLIPSIWSLQLLNIVILLSITCIWIKHWTYLREIFFKNQKSTPKFSSYSSMWRCMFCVIEKVKDIQYKSYLFIYYFPMPIYKYFLVILFCSGCSPW